MNKPTQDQAWDQMLDRLDDVEITDADLRAADHLLRQANATPVRQELVEDIVMRARREAAEARSGRRWSVVASRRWLMTAAAGVLAMGMIASMLSHRIWGEQDIGGQSFATVIEILVRGDQGERSETLAMRAVADRVSLAVERLHFVSEDPATSAAIRDSVRASLGELKARLDHPLDPPALDPSLDLQREVAAVSDGTLTDTQRLGHLRKAIDLAEVGVAALQQVSLRSSQLRRKCDQRLKSLRDLIQ